MEIGLQPILASECGESGPAMLLVHSRQWFSISAEFPDQALSPPPKNPTGRNHQLSLMCFDSDQRHY